jgi:hypothetical protein
MKVEVSLVAPAEWRTEPDVLTLSIPPRAKTSGQVAISVPKGWQAHSPRFAIAADVVRDGKYLGQITEAVIEIV